MDSKQSDSIVNVAIIINHLIVPIIIYFVTFRIRIYFNREERLKLNLKSQQKYHAELGNQYRQMESQKLDEEIAISEEIKQLNDELDDDMHSDSNSNDWDDLDEDRSSLDDTDGYKKAAKHLDSLKEKESQLVSVEKTLGDVKDVMSELNLDDISRLDNTSNLDALKSKVQHLESENRQLKLDLHKRNSLSIGIRESDALDPQIVQFLENNKGDLSLDYLEKFYDTILGFKVEHPDTDLNEYIEQLKKTKADYLKELGNLRVAKKEAEIRYKQMKSHYEEEMQIFTECRIENLLKSKGYSEYLDRLKEKNKISDEIIYALRKELDTKSKELSDIKHKLHEAESQKERYLKAKNDMKLKLDKLEADRRNNDLSFINRMSGGSSYLGDVPPPPDLEIPAIEEFLRTGDSLNADCYSQLSMSYPIPPPPEVTFDEIRNELSNQKTSVISDSYSSRSRNGGNYNRHVNQ